MDPRAKRFQNYRWAIAVLAGMVVVLGTFIFYAATVIQSHKDESYRQTFRGLALIGQDISDNLDNMRLILANYLPAPERSSRPSSLTDHWVEISRKTILPSEVATFKEIAARDELFSPSFSQEDLEHAWGAWTAITNEKLDDLRKTPSFRDLTVSPLANRVTSNGFQSEPECLSNQETNLVISEFKEIVRLVDCRTPTPYSDAQCIDAHRPAGCSSPRFKASVSINSLVDYSYVDGLADALLIADFQGKILYQNDRENETFARITDIRSLFAKDATLDGKAPAGTEDSCGGKNQLLSAKNGSTVICATLSGADYLLFIQPQVLPLPAALSTGDKISKGQVFYIVGVKRKPGFLETLDGLPVRTVGFVLGFLVLLVIALPVLKLRLIGRDERLQAVDAFLYFGSVLLITTGLTLLVLDYTAYKALREQMDATAEKIGEEIQSQFHAELEASVKTLGEITYSNGDESGIIPFPNDQFYPPYQIFTPLDGKGELSGRQITYRERMEAPGKLSDRPYFRMARAGVLWTLHDEGNTKAVCDQFILDRIRVRSTGDKLSVLAEPSAQMCRNGTLAPPANTRSQWASKELIRTSIKTFLSLRSHLLPPFYEFAVFDDATGKVMYHSDDSRSLLEYFYAQLSVGRQLRSAMEYRHLIQMDGEYLGKDVAISVRPLDDVPWSVAVFYDREAIQSIHFEIVAISSAVMIGFTLVFVMLPLLLRHHLASGPSWALICQQQSLTKTYWWLSIVFLLEAAFILVAIWCAHVPAGVTMIQGPLLVGSLVYVTLNPASLRRWPKLWVAAGCAVSLILLAILFGITLAERSRIGLSPAAVMFALGIFLIAAVIELHTLVKAKGGGANRPNMKTGGLETADAFLSAPLTAMGRAFRSLNLRRIVGTLAEKAGASSTARIKYLRVCNAVAYFALGATALLLIAVVPTVGTFEEMFRNHMDSLTRYGQAYLAEKYVERYKILQADAARMKPKIFSTPDAHVIDIDWPLKLAGVYASLQNIFPANGLDPTDFALWERLTPRSIGELNLSTSAGRPWKCFANDPHWQLTSLIVSRLPSFDDTSEKMHGFLPKFDGVNQSCWKIERARGEMVLSADSIEMPHLNPVNVTDIQRWPKLISGSGVSWSAVVVVFFVLSSVVLLWFTVKLATKRFLASEIPYPIEPNVEESESQETLEATKWARAVVYDREHFHLLIRMPSCQLEKFKEVVQDSIEKALMEKPNGPQRYFLNSLGKKQEGDELGPLRNSAILILTDFHIALGSTKLLDELLDLLETRSRHGLRTAILSDLYPLEVINHPQEYPDLSQGWSEPDAVKTARWIRLISQYTSHYWPPRHLMKSSEDALQREILAFPDLKNLADRLIRFLNTRPNLTDIEIAELVRMHARGYYASLWRLCTKKERVLLFRLAQGDLVNPANNGDLTRLLERGILRRDPLIRLPNLSFALFILSVESAERYEDWAGATTISAWSVARIPLFALIILISVTVAFMGKQTSDYVLALLGTAAAMPPLLFRLLGSFALRPSGPPAG